MSLLNDMNAALAEDGGRCSEVPAYIFKIRYSTAKS